MNIKKSARSFVKFQLIPLPAVGLILFFLGKLNEMNWITLNFDIFAILYDPLFLSFLGICSFLYIDHFYKEKITCNCHQGWKRKYHQIAGYVTGIFAAFTSYLIPVAILSFIVFDSASNGSVQSQNVELFSIKIPFFLALAIFGFITRFISKDIFESLDGKSGILFNAKKSFPQQIKEEIPSIQRFIPIKY